MKSSPNDSIKELWKSTNSHTNIQYDVYNSTKQVLKEFQSGQEDKLKNHLICQGSFFAHASKFSLSRFNAIWSAAQSNLPKNIFNFTIRYINNSLPTRKNLSRWGLASNIECSFCLYPETLLHVVAGCQSYLERFTWRHNSILNFLAKTLQSTNVAQLYADLPGFKCPSIITGDTFRPDLLLLTPNKSLYVVELRQIRKFTQSRKFLLRQSRKFTSVNFVNLSVSSLGVFDKECYSLLQMLNGIGLDKKHQEYCLKKITSLAIRTTYYIFCRRNKEWTNPDLLNF